MSAAAAAYSVATVLTSDTADATGHPLGTGTGAAAPTAPESQRGARHTVYVEHPSVPQAPIAAPAPLQEVFPVASRAGQLAQPMAQQMPQAQLVMAFPAQTPVDAAHLHQVSYPAAAQMGYTTMAVQYAVPTQVGQLPPLLHASASYLPPLPQVFPQHPVLLGPQGGWQPGAPLPAMGVPAGPAKAGDAAEATEGPETSRKHSVAVNARHKARHCC
jgi:hypothetical protein